MTRSNRRYIVYKPKYHLTKREKRQNKGKGSDGQPWHDELQSLPSPVPHSSGKGKERKKFISEKKIPACSAYSTEVGSNKAPAQPAKLQRNAAQCNAAYLI